MTYLIKNNVAYFLSREILSNPYPQAYTLHYFNGKHPLEMVRDGIVTKVINTPFKLSKEFHLNGDMAIEFNAEYYLCMGDGGQD